MNLVSFLAQAAYLDLSASHMVKKNPPPPTESLPCRASVDRKHNLSQECDLASKSSKCDLKWHQEKTSGQDKEGYSPRVHSAGVGSHLENGVCVCVLKLI